MGVNALLPTISFEMFFASIVREVNVSFMFCENKHMSSCLRINGWVLCSPQMVSISYILSHYVRLFVRLWPLDTPLDAQTKWPLDAERSDGKKKSDRWTQREVTGRSDGKKKSDRWTQREVTGRREKWRRMRSVRASRSRIEVSRPRRTGPFFFLFFFALYCRRRRCCSGHGFRDMVFGTWDLNFEAWIFTLAVSKTRGFQDRNLKTFKTWILGCGTSILRPGFHTGASHWPSATGTH
jgi:hypothetical protein